jgi:hypothetical protein
VYGAQSRLGGVDAAVSGVPVDDTLRITGCTPVARTLSGNLLDGGPRFCSPHSVKRILVVIARRFLRKLS